MFTQDLNLVNDIIESNDKQKALPILAKILKSDPHNEKAWIYLFFCIEDKKRKFECLNRALEINPKNENVKNLLEQIDSGFDKLISPDQLLLEVLSKKPERDQKKENCTRMKENNQVQKTALPDLAVENVKKLVEEQKARDSKKKDKTENKPITANKDEPVKKTNKEKKVKGNRKNQKLESDFFHGFREGINQSSRLETGVFGRRTIVDGLRISPYGGPPCLKGSNDFSEEECDSCEYFSPRNCLLRFDEDLFDDLNRIAEIRAERLANQIRRSQIVSTIIHQELKTHGRPLHYSMISKIIIGRYPKLHLTEKSIRKFMEWHPELFERIEEGIYRAK